MRHVALITTSYPDRTPGSEAAGSFVEDFARELSHKARVTVMAAASAAGVASEGNLTVRRFAVPRLPLSLLKPARPDHWKSIIQTLRSGRRALDQLVEQDRPDHILALWALPSGYWANAIAGKHGIPFSIWALGSDIWSLGRVPLIRGQLRRVLKSASLCYADGYELGAATEKLCGRECRFLPSTRQIDAPPSRRLSDSPPYKLAFLGRWHPNKGIDLLLDALGQLGDGDWQKISEVRIHGGGPLADTVNKRIHSLRERGKPVSQGGYLDKAGASELMAWGDYLLLPSRIESIPVIFSDAVKSGIPLISTPVGDLPRLHENHEFGILAASATVAGYCEAIRSALNRNPGDFRYGLEQARKDFDLARITDRFLAETADCQ